MGIRRKSKAPANCCLKRCSNRARGKHSAYFAIRENRQGIQNRSQQRGPHLLVCAQIDTGTHLPNHTAVSCSECVRVKVRSNLKKLFFSFSSKETTAQRRPLRSVDQGTKKDRFSGSVCPDADSLYFCIQLSRTFETPTTHQERSPARNYEPLPEMGANKLLLQSSGKYNPG